MIRASGPTGVLRVGYQWAAQLGPWEMAAAAGKPAFAFHARVQAESLFWMAERPLDLVLMLGQVEWVWRGVEPVREGATVRLTLTERPVVSERAPMQMGPAG